jgi:hypothetical protein
MTRGYEAGGRALWVLAAVGLWTNATACSTEPQQPPANKAASSSVEAAPHEHAAAAPGAAPGAATSVLAPAGAKVTILEPADGAVVTGPLVDGKVTVHVKMGVEGIEVKPAGAPVQGTGHHHIIVDGSGVPIGDAVPKDATHLHFGQGQTEADVPLAPGPHELTLQFADGAHLSYGPQLTSSITIDVQAKGEAAPAAK